MPKKYVGAHDILRRGAECTLSVSKVAKMEKMGGGI